MIVQTVDGTSLPIVGCCIFSTSSFHVPSVLRIPKLAMHLRCASQINEHDCRIILVVDSGSPTGASVVLGVMILRAFGSFTSCVFLHPLYLSSHPVLPPPRQLHRNYYAVASSSSSSLRRYRSRLPVGCFR